VVVHKILNMVLLCVTALTSKIKAFFYWIRVFFISVGFLVCAVIMCRCSHVIWIEEI